jgi:hypothetical protein
MRTLNFPVLPRQIQGVLDKTLEKLNRVDRGTFKGPVDLTSVEYRARPGVLNANLDFLQRVVMLFRWRHVSRFRFRMLQFVISKLALVNQQKRA